MHFNTVGAEILRHTLLNTRVTRRYSVLLTSHPCFEDRKTRIIMLLVMNAVASLLCITVGYVSGW